MNFRIWLLLFFDSVLTIKAIADDEVQLSPGEILAKVCKKINTRDFFFLHVVFCMETRRERNKEKISLSQMILSGLKSYNVHL